MKKMIKKVMAAMLVLALSFSMAQITQQANVSAAPKALTKADFNLDDEDGNYNLIKSSNAASVAFNYFVNDGDEDNLYDNEDCITQRGVKINSDKKDVVNKYGSTSVKNAKYKKDKFYSVVNRYFGYNKVKKAIKYSKKYMDYTYSKGENNYTIRFYLNKNNKVVLVGYFKNYNDFLDIRW